jgi:hypothetical protein
MRSEHALLQPMPCLTCCSPLFPVRFDQGSRASRVRALQERQDQVRSGTVSSSHSAFRDSAQPLPLTLPARHCHSALIRSCLFGSFRRRPCKRCVRVGREASCEDSIHKKRGRKRAVPRECFFGGRGRFLRACPARLLAGRVLTRWCPSHARMQLRRSPLPVTSLQAMLLVYLQLRRTTAVRAVPTPLSRPPSALAREAALAPVLAVLRRQRPLADGRTRSMTMRTTSLAMR